MKSLIIINLILTLSLISSSCKKKYPDGTPTWLVNKIKVLEQYAKDYNHNGCDGTCEMVEQYTDGSSTYYWIYSGGSGPETTVYDYNGSQVCHIYSGSVGCNQYKKTFVQRVWIETH